jgi:Tfp pilus assembly protein PilX
MFSTILSHIIERKKVNNKKGITLLMALATVLVVVFLANAILALILSHYRLTHHQVSRIRAYYAAQAGIVLALENLRTGDWDYDKSYCINCTSGVPKNRRVTDADIPYEVMIDIGKYDADQARAPISATATYTPQ